MRANRWSNSATRNARTGRAVPAWLGATAALLITAVTPAHADEHMVLVDTIAVGDKDLGAFDISFVDPAIDLYVLADRTNGSVDFFDASDNTYIGSVGGFKGVVLKPDGTANNALSAPDGVVIVDHRYVWAGDGDSTVKVIDIATFSVAATIPVTDPTTPSASFRVDEMAYDSADHIIAVANNANVPPFITLIDTNSHAILGQIVFNGKNGTPDATNTGIEQPQWSPKTGKFYLSLPQIDAKNAAQGGVAVIDPASMQVTAVYPVQDCTPAGLAIGPNHQALVGCSASFGTSPNVLTQSIVIDITNGDVRANITQVGGSDEVWFDAGTQHYYFGARNNQDSAGKIAPALGTVDARTNAFDGVVPTSTTAHSVAADRRSHHVFVPIGMVPAGSAAGTDATNPCPKHGCIAVYLPSSSDDDDGTRIARR
jgi:hypothetical protein